MRLTTKRLCLTALLAAFTAVISQIAIPLPFLGVPLTLQIFAVALCGYLLGPVYGTLSILLYIALGICGLPVFTGFNAGFGALLGPTGGFILGFLPLSLNCGTASRLNRPFRNILNILGTVLCHLFGAVYYMYLTQCGFFTAAVSASLPFIIKDILLVFAAEQASNRIRKLL